ncbi:MAG: hypothetical protein A2365_02125 [Candidatus Nealsonbacteria bacterium RIFOXYB1_FULL_40_15]|uniref:Uncharacterized protein n=1 Tax=Candidatus Nealsonbacteria bacterium RIFOXYB1_FULL_40_15 TaxID=1801677 RepID=A0A1G2EMC1_9BACT|nr:MAG: hypothetical protein A2365_02125 [Candidatus Nealsonbacteria bacterium RIFOXYB1_FULL_40_15]
MTLVSVEHRLASVDEQNVEITVPELLQDLVQIRHVLIAWWRWDDAFVVHRLALEDMVAIH